MIFNEYKNRNIVRIFPLEEYEEKKDKIKMGVIYINDDEKCLLDDKEEVFTSVPQRTDSRIYDFDDINKHKQEKLKKIISIK